MATARPRLAVYWASGCGGCEAAFLDLGADLLEIERAFEIVSFPLLCDNKLATIEELEDGAVDIALVTGAVRTEHDLEMVGTLRRVSKYLIALGACSHIGSVVGLANVTGSAEFVRHIYGRAGHEGALPEPVTKVASGTIDLGDLTDRVQPLEDVAPVDYSVPGCPPEADRILETMQLLLEAIVVGGELPSPGSVLGATDGTVCEECPLPQPQSRARRFFRIHEVAPDPELCLLDQGLICSGPVTRGGCGALCPAAGSGCRGCYGGPPGIHDQGARLMAALAGLAGVDEGEADETREELLRQRVDDEVKTLVDPVGTLYRYSFPVSLLDRLGREGEGP